MNAEYTLRDLKLIADAIREDNEHPYESRLQGIILDSISEELTSKQYDMFLAYAFAETDDWEIVKDEFRP